MAIPRVAHFITAILYKKLDNSIDYDINGIEFKAKINSNENKGSFYALNGLVSDNVSISLYSQDDIVSQIKANDKVRFMGNEYLVQSVGIYLDNALAMSLDSYNEEDLYARCPKGIQLV